MVVEPNINFAWGVEKIECFWYWYDEQGTPYGPYDTEEKASDALDDYEYDCYNDPHDW